MKRKLLPILLLGAFLIAGCATKAPVRNTDSANVIYTNAPINVAFDASCTALKNLGYKIEEKNADNFSVSGSCNSILTGHTTVRARINVSKEEAGTKIACVVDRPGVVKTLDVIGYYSANNIYKEIVKGLAEDEISYRNANKVKREKKEKRARDSLE
ncbi:MAG: hypothetical protein NTY76_06175 [Candidatus Omnitrophica bacterium]|nr:hypothetical protein [Candidatus Omnitrophota bacterium]